MNIAAILWDYDGTIVDSTKKNIAVTKEVLNNYIEDINNNLPEALTSLENYQKANYKYKNWRELYKYAYGLTDEQMDEAGKLWSPYQLANDTLPDMFEGMSHVIKELGKYKQGICSQNCAKNIKKTLTSFGLDEYFGAIRGYEEVSYSEQKPNPAAFINCIEQLNIPMSKSTMFYIGDHQEDTIFGKNAMAYYQSKGYDIEVICIGAEYSGHSSENWVVKPDYIANSPEEILDIINSIANRS